MLAQQEGCGFGNLVARAHALFIVPGIPLINFVSDMLSGYTQVGVTRAMGTLTTLLAMAFGIAFAIQVCGIDNFAKDLPMTPIMPTTSIRLQPPYRPSASP